MAWLRTQGIYFWLALGFFTRLPIPPGTPFSPALLNHASRYFSLVGWLVGVITSYSIHYTKLYDYRLVAAESDGLPGITIDRYNDHLVCQLLSAGAEFHRDTLFAALNQLYPECSIYERSDVAVRKKEGLQQRTGLVSGELPPPEVVIEVV